MSAHPVKEMHGCTPEDIPASVLTSTEPMILRGLVAHWPLVSAANSSHADLCDYLQRFDHQADVGAFFGEPQMGGRYFYTADGDRLNFSKRMTKLSQVLAILLTNAKVAHPPYVYMGSENIARILPGLHAANPLPALAQHQPRANLWLGNRSRVAAHYDMPTNLACCVAGKRVFSLFPPEQIAHLYPGSLDFSPSGQAVSHVDFHHPDWQRFPKFRQALKVMQVAELTPGDALYLPGMWWHHVEAPGSVNALLNFWWWSAPAFASAPVDALHHALFAIKDLPLAQRRAWQQVFDYYVFSEDEQRFDHIPQALRGRLQPVDEPSARRIRNQLLNSLNR